MLVGCYNCHLSARRDYVPFQTANLQKFLDIIKISQASLCLRKNAAPESHDQEAAQPNLKIVI